MKTLLASPFLLSGFFTIHALLMNGYKYGWWENLVIHAYYLPATFTRVDPSLYPRDFFVNAMKQNIINSSFFWEGMARLFKFFPVEPAVFIIYLLGLYCIFLALFYLAQTLFQNKLVSCAVLLLYSFGLRQFNLGSEAIYFNFLHSGIVGYPLLLLSIILFLKKRYQWSFFVCGFLFNFHSMYVTFLLCMYGTFFLLRLKDLSLKTVITCALSFAFPALPSLVFIIPHLQASYGGAAWLTGIKWTHWVHDFPAYWGMEQYGRFAVFVFLLLISLTSSRLTDTQKNALLLFPGIAIMCLLGSVFSEVKPIPVIIKLQLWRSLGIFILIGAIFISNFLIRSWGKEFMSRFCIIAIAIIMTGYSAYKNALPPEFWRIPLWLLPVVTLYLFIHNRYCSRQQYLKTAKGCMALVLLVVTIAPFISPLRETFLNIGTDLLTIFYCVIGFLLVLSFLESRFNNPEKKYRLYSAMFLVFLCIYDGGLLWRQNGPHIAFPSAEKKFPHPWIDMQLYCKSHTPKDALFIVPPYMQGFRLFSQRSTFGDWLDGMLINWKSEDFAVEWLKRMRLLGWTDVKGEWSSYNHLSTGDFLNIAREYKADYIVGERRLRLNLTVVYENNAYVLYATGVSRDHHQ